MSVRKYTDQPLVRESVPPPDPTVPVSSRPRRFHWVDDSSSPCPADGVAPLRPGCDSVEVCSGPSVSWSGCGSVKMYSGRKVSRSRCILIEVLAKRYDSRAEGGPTTAARSGSRAGPGTSMERTVSTGTDPGDKTKIGGGGPRRENSIPRALNRRKTRGTEATRRKTKKRRDNGRDRQTGKHRTTPHPFVSGGTSQEAGWGGEIGGRFRSSRSSLD